MSRPPSSAGFTLIELMIVVAIIAIIAAIAIPQYQVYVIRSQLTSALAEIDPGRVAYEILVDDNITDGSVYADVDNLGLSDQTPRCSSITAQTPASGAGSIKCVLKGHASIENSYIKLNRSTSGQWTCVSDVASIYLPVNCING